MAQMFACPEPKTDARRLAGAALAAALRDSRARTLALVGDLSDAQWLPRHRPGVNPLAWELGHLAWFGEFWMLRGPHRLSDGGLIDAARPPRIAGPDDLFDSARLAHVQRWQRPLPSRKQVLDMLEAQLEACLAAVPGIDTDDDAALYFARLTLFHEDMHGEAFAWMRAALGYPAPEGMGLKPCGTPRRLVCPGGEIALGRPAGEGGFAFDNERTSGARTILQPFAIDSVPLTTGQFLAFVEAGGYRQPGLWSEAGQRWLARSEAQHPSRWRRDLDGSRQQCVFDRWLPLDSSLPMIHINAHEAEAYCRWAGGRLPSAAEWELAARTLGPAGFAWGGSVWEWTADAFEPYAGFEPGPYRDYSQPWFGSHRELRGGSFAAHARLHDARYRNFFMPERSDIFAGLRCAWSVD